MKSLRAALRNVVTEADRSRLQLELQFCGRHIANTLRRIREITKFSMGASIKKDSKLNPITSMKPPVENRALEAAQHVASVDHDEWAGWLFEEYSKKWRCSEDVRIKAYKQFLPEHDNTDMQLTVAEVSAAFSSFKRESRIDHYQVCLSCLWNLFCVRDVAFTKCLNDQIGSSALAALWSVKGRFYSKVNGPCFPRQTRAILPVPGTLSIIDTIVAVRCTEHLLRLPAPDPCFIEAARKGRSTTDVIFATRQAVEKGMDSHGRTALGAADIKRFYDGVDPLLTRRTLIEDGLPLATALAFARLHICVNVLFELPTRTLTFAARAGAVLTGTRTSIIAGRVVILDVGKTVAPIVKGRGLVLIIRVGVSCRS